MYVHSENTGYTKTELTDCQRSQEVVRNVLVLDFHQAVGSIQTLIRGLFICSLGWFCKEYSRETQVIHCQLKRPIEIIENVDAKIMHEARLTKHMSDGSFHVTEDT